MNNRLVLVKERWLYWILKINLLICKFSIVSIVYCELRLLNVIVFGKGKSFEIDINNNVKLFMLLLFNYNEFIDYGNNNNDVFE